MLFNNYEPFEIPAEGPISRAELIKRFPEFYGENPQPVKLVVTPSRIKRVRRVSEKDKIFQKVVSLYPQPTGHRASASLIIDGKPVILQYSTVLPNVNIASKNFPPGTDRITLQNGFQVFPGQEDLLFYLYFGCNVIKDNGMKAVQPMYEWSRPIEKAKAKIDEARKRMAFDNLIYNELTSDHIRVIFRGLGLDLKATDELNRTFLHDRVRTGNDVFKQTFDELVASVKGKKEEATTLSMSDTVNKLIEEEKIKEEEGKWYHKSKVNLGEWNKTPFYDSKKDNSEDARFALIETLKDNEVMLNKIK